MLRSINSPPDPHDLRHILVQPTPFSSPHSPDRDRLVLNSGFSRSRSSSASDRSSPASPRDLLSNTSASILDLDDDTGSSIVSQTTYDDDGDDDESTQEALDDDGQANQPRMSMLGPKMRFHSRAPWETGEDTLQEEDEFQEGRPSISSFRPARSKASKGEAIMKGLGLGTSNLRTSRPSGESSRSQTKPKRSFESTLSQASSPRSALSALTQASMSSTSLSLVPPLAPPPNVRPRPYTPTTSISSPTSFTSPPSLSPSSLRSMALSYVSTGSPITSGHSGNSSLPSEALLQANNATPSNDDVHPYANPENAVPHSRDQIAASPLRTGFTFPNHNSSPESTTTTKDSLSISSLTRSKTPSTLTLDKVPSSGSQSDHRIPSRTPSRVSMFQGKEISSPISVVNPAIRENDVNPPSHDRSRDHKDLSVPAAPGLAGWGDHLGSPTFSLISLEEARAQRMRSVTAQAAISTRTDTPPVPFPEDATSTVGGHQSRTSIYHTSTRSRGRSISAGAKATKSALQHMVGGPSPPKPERRDSEPSTAQRPQCQQIPNDGAAGRQLKHKKSGFMRLFNGKEPKEREKERDRSPPPPVPPLAETYTESSGPSSVPAVPKRAAQRVPVPRVSPALLDPSPDLHSNSSEYLGRPESSISSTSNISSVSKRAPPPLTIDNSSHIPPAPASDVSASVSQHSRTTPMPRHAIQRAGKHSLSPQSAPAHTGDFPALSLRPVSTLFSAHFAEHIVQMDSPSSQEGDVDGSNSPSTGFSSGPFTPGSSLRSIHEKMEVSINSDDQSAVIQALQDQITSSKISWQRRIWELEGQVRELKAEVQATENDKTYCEACGRGLPVPQHSDSSEGKKVGMINRPRPSTGVGSARFVN